MKKNQSKLQVIINYYQEAEPTLLYLSTDEEGSSKDEVLVLGDGNIIWLSDIEGPEVPLLSVENLATEHPSLLFELFTSADEEEKLDSKKLFQFEEKLRKALKQTTLEPEKIRDIKIAFLDAKESILEG